MPRVLVFYHYFHPDQVVAAQLYSDLCRGLQDQGWEVVVLPCSRGFRDPESRLPLRESWKGVFIRRIWRPPLRQSSTAGRILNAVWMLAAWAVASLFYRADAVIIGSDPIFSVLVAIPWRLLHPKVRIFHWCFDLYPEAAVAAGLVAPKGMFIRLVGPLLRWAYRCCDAVGSLGPCMTRRLKVYDDGLKVVEVTTWALAEFPSPLPADMAVRREVFGDASLALMYSGSLGRAHAFEDLLRLARELRGAGVAFSFSVQGNRVEALKSAITPEDTNISIRDMVPPDHLERHLSSADIQIVTLRPEYSGTVVPSKFQGALATGRPILYSGDPDSALGIWIRHHGLGWCLTRENVPEIARELLALKSDSDRLAAMKDRCFRTYGEHFSKSVNLSAIHELCSEGTHPV